jgi:hypothetical protein
LFVCLFVCYSHFDSWDKRIASARKNG